MKLQQSENYSPGWKLVQLKMGTRPQGFLQWIRFLWGWDLWAGPIPLIKMNVFGWCLVILTGG